jgi:hypothetical protein
VNTPAEAGFSPETTMTRYFSRRTLEAWHRPWVYLVLIGVLALVLLVLYFGCR